MVWGIIKRTFSEIKKQFRKIVATSLTFCAIEFFVIWLSLFLTTKIIDSMFEDSLLRKFGYLQFITNQAISSLELGPMLISTLISLIVSLLMFPLVLGYLNSILKRTYSIKDLFSFYNPDEYKFSLSTFAIAVLPVTAINLLYKLIFNGLMHVGDDIRNYTTMVLWSRISSLFYYVILIWFTWIELIYIYKSLKNKGNKISGLYKSSHRFCYHKFNYMLILDLVLAIVLMLVFIIVLNAFSGNGNGLYAFTAIMVILLWMFITISSMASLFQLDKISETFEPQRTVPDTQDDNSTYEDATETSSEKDNASE